MSNPVAADGDRTRTLDPVDLIGAVIVLWLAVWLAASATRSGRPVLDGVGTLAIGAAAYLMSRASRRAGRWPASLAITLAAVTVAVLHLGTLLDQLEGPLGYANATGAFFVLAAAHATIVARSAAIPWARTLAGLSALAFGAVPWLNSSRTAAAMTLLLVVAMAVPTLQGRRLRIVAGVAAAGVAAVVVLTSLSGAVYVEPEEGTAVERLLDETLSDRRLELWHDAVVLTASEPLRGVGLGRFGETSPTAQRFPEQAWAHHEYLHIAAETGIPGMLLLLAVVGWGFVRTATSDDPNAVLVLAGWVAVTTHASLDYILHFPAVVALAGALLGAVSTRQSLDLPGPASRGAAPEAEGEERDTSPGARGADAGHLSLSPDASTDHARRRETSAARDRGPVGQEWVMSARRWDARGPASEGTSATPASPASEPSRAEPTDDVIARRLLPSVRAAAIRMRLDYTLVALDATLIVAAYAAALLLRFDGAVPEPFASRAPRFFAMAVAAHLLANGFAGLYGHVWQQASIDEARRVVVANVMAAVWLLAWVSALPSERAPLTVVISGGGIALLLTGVVRFRSRLFAFQIGRSSARGDNPDRVIIVGSGVAARGVIDEMRTADPADYRPVAIIDADPTHHGRTLLNLPVVGGLDSLPRAAGEHRADLVLIADPDLHRSDVEDLMTTARSAGLDVKVLPNVTELMGQAASVRDVRDLAITDLLGRRPVPTDLEAIRSILAGRCVMVTGGGGSIGSELARQISACDPERLILLDHDETHLHDAVARLPGDVLQVLADVRDSARIDRVVATLRPEIIFHAAAHKHVPILEEHPGEAVATNVLGTQNLIRAAKAFGVERFVFISTDKAVNPRSVMGATKRLGEQLVLQADGTGTVRFCAVRFGNVLGSRGSVIPTFVEQIRRGGPVTVTHPDMTRFFMTIPEATQLVLQAAAFSDGGDIFMLDMGEPVRIVDLANRMIRLSGRRPDVDIPIRFTGLRPGEKIAEELASEDEHSRATPHPSIAALAPTLLDPRLLRDGVEHLRQLAARHADDDVVRLLFDLAAVPDETVLVIPDPEPLVPLPLARLREAR